MKTAFLLGVIGSFGTIIAGAVLVSEGTLDFGTVMAVVTLQMSVSNAMQRLGGSISALTTSMVRASHVFDFMELDMEEQINWFTGEKSGKKSLKVKIAMYSGKVSQSLKYLICNFRTMKMMN